MKKVIYTVIVDGYDVLLEQPKFPGWDYVCFTDGKRLPLKARFGLSNWKIVRLENLGYRRPLNSRIPKILPHLYLADYDYSVYIDGNAYLIEDPATVLDRLDWPDFLNAAHPRHPHLSEEFAECIQGGKADPNLLDTQRKNYLSEGLPEDTALMENNLLMRRHLSPEVRNIGEQWWREMNRASHRDQLSLPYICWKFGYQPQNLKTDEKRAFFRTKSHFRSLFYRIIKSLEKQFS